MPYPFCVIGDVQALNAQRPTYASTTKPTSTQVNKFMDEIHADLLGIVSDAGYDLDNLHEVSSTVSGALTSGDDATVTVADASEMSKGDLIKIEGLTSGVRAWEFTEIEAISTNDLTVDLANDYDASSVTVYVLNGALQALRKINAYGAAAMAEETAFMGVSPNQSDHAETLWNHYWGSEERQEGVWAIQNLPGFLDGATTTDEMVSDETMTSYQVENTDDDYVDSGPTFGMTQKW